MGPSMQYPQGDQNKAILNENEISFQDIADFVQKSWKKIVVAAVVGAIAGFSYWHFLGVYSAKIVLLNNNNTLDIVSWKALQKSLPDLAAQIIQQKTISTNESSFFRTMNSEDWWQKNVIPIFALSKEDVKGLAAISKDLDGASTSIIGFTLIAHSNDQNLAKKDAITAVQFIRSGGAYLQLRALVNKYDNYSASSQADVKQRVAKIESEIDYLKNRSKNLEDLQKRFPDSANMMPQVTSFENSSSKYLPVTTQIIAANTDIYLLKEDLVRLRKQLDQTSILNKFLDQAIPLQNENFDGLDLAEKFLAIETDLQDKLVKNGFNSAPLLQQLHFELITIQSRFNKGLEINSQPVLSKGGMIKSITTGLVGGLFLMLLVLLGKTVLHKKSAENLTS
jgi:hypothetical protein